MFTTLFSTSRQIVQAFAQRAAAIGLAAAVTLTVLGSIDQLATAPTPDSLLATAKTTQPRS